MLLKNIHSFKKNILARGQYYYDLGRDIYLAGMEVYNSRQQELPKKDSKVEKNEDKGRKGNASEGALRKNLEKNLSVPDPKEPAELARQTSLKSHKVLDHEPGEKWNSNMWQRNYNNHQGN